MYRHTLSTHTHSLIHKYTHTHTYRILLHIHRLTHTIGRRKKEQHSRSCCWLRLQRKGFSKAGNLPASASSGYCYKADHCHMLSLLIMSGLHFRTSKRSLLPLPKCSHMSRNLANVWAAAAPGSLPSGGSCGCSSVTSHILLWTASVSLPCGHWFRSADQVLKPPELPWRGCHLAPEGVVAFLYPCLLATTL